jgi:ribosomal protein S18 acetylase RimI-like enzyme
MELREASKQDIDELTAVARQSLTQSYGEFLAAETIDQMIDRWYDDDRVSKLIIDHHAMLETAEIDGDIVGFVQGRLVGTDPVVGEIEWLHVLPDHRGSGVGVQLLAEIQDTFRDRGATVVHGLVLGDNEDGTGFYTHHGFEQVGEREVEIDGDPYTEAIFETSLGEGPRDQVVEETTGPDGQALYVNFSAGQRGKRAPFYPTFETEALEQKYGWYCGDCGSLDNAMDPMGRIVCNDCGNKRKASRWDSSYM